MQGVYVPFWTFDALSHNRWTAEAGHYYTVQVEAIENGKRVMRSETRTRWEPAAGFLEKAFDDVPVPASKGLPPGLARGIEPFPTGGLVPYDPQYLSGFLAEEYAVDLPDALGDREGADDAGDLRRLRRAGAGRHPAQPPGLDGLVGPDVQERASPALDLGLRVRRQALPLSRQRRDREGRRARAVLGREDRSRRRRRHRRPRPVLEAELKWIGEARHEPPRGASRRLPSWRDEGQRPAPPKGTRAARPFGRVRAST